MKLCISLSLLLFATIALRLRRRRRLPSRKATKITIAISKLEGADGAADAKTLQNDLAMSGYFTVSPADRAQYVVSGNSAGASLAGRVADRGGKTALSKSYSGAGRSKVHHFADDIVETLTGNRGIASTRIAFVATRTGKGDLHRGYRWIERFATDAR